jgi:hypothetical protein
MWANHSLTLSNNTELNSLVDNECANDKDGNRGLYECMAIGKHVELLKFQDVLDHYNEQYDLRGQSNNRFYAKKPINMRDKIQSKWSIYLISLGSINVEGSKMRAPRIGICANEINVNTSKIDSSMRGCKADQGLGPG